MAAKQLVHIVYFTLAEQTDERRQALVESCHKFLSDHPGTVYFGAGERAEEYDRPVNDDQFDVALHIVFESKEAHDTYQVSPRHQEFLETNKPTWAAVRVFDSYV